MARRQLPDHAAIALEIIADFGRRDIPKNEFLLRLHQRGLNGRDAGEAIRAFQRRGWVELDGRSLVMTEAAFDAARHGVRAHAPTRRHRQRRVPNLFA
ncbi:MAG: hypothetical protein KF889_10860 [Alphaproteobacteria bacterium]|nr:hypothetical protein [Alphaproteobacteria bacterium]MCW5741325.1 hypothetical protein [Alphaproteobacteria bacterium]